MMLELASVKISCSGGIIKPMLYSVHVSRAFLSAELPSSVHLNEMAIWTQVFFFIMHDQTRMKTSL